LRSMVELTHACRMKYIMQPILQLSRARADKDR